METKVIYSKSAKKSIEKYDKSTKLRIREGIEKLLLIPPEAEQNLAYEFVKRIVLAWDPDYTKVTPAERASLERAEQEFQNGEFFTEEEIDWN